MWKDLMGTSDEWLLAFWLSSLLFSFQWGELRKLSRACGHRVRTLLQLGLLALLPGLSYGSMFVGHLIIACLSCTALKGLSHPCSILFGNFSIFHFQSTDYTKAPMRSGFLWGFLSILSSSLTARILNAIRITVDIYQVLMMCQVLC